MASTDEGKKKLKIVLVGRTGVGKSATGNTILANKVFSSTSSSASVTSECQLETKEYEDLMLGVVDTPGLFDTKDENEVVKEIVKCISFAAPGPHVFLVVLQAGRFTTEEQETVRIIQKIFGEKAADYTMALFTRGDDLDEDGITIEEFIAANPALRAFIRKCAKYHVFNNRDKDPSQVIELLKKINTLVELNGGSCYTNEMLEDAENAIQEEIHELRRNNPRLTPGEAKKQALRNPHFTPPKIVTITKYVTRLVREENQQNGEQGGCIIL